MKRTLTFVLALVTQALVVGTLLYTHAIAKRALEVARTAEQHAQQLAGIIASEAVEKVPPTVKPQETAAAPTPVPKKPAAMRVAAPASPWTLALQEPTPQRIQDVSMRVAAARQQWDEYELGTGRPPGWQPQVAQTTAIAIAFDRYRLECAKLAQVAPGSSPPGSFAEASANYVALVKFYTKDR